VGDQVVGVRSVGGQAARSEVRGRSDGQERGRREVRSVLFLAVRSEVSGTRKAGERTCALELEGAQWHVMMGFGVAEWSSVVGQVVWRGVSASSGGQE